ncbi:hypothetical protein AZE42_11624 [Rhizopogon vesiculosus]|uniref:Uncharacterized protein n=1 Tax=Rhizopogon vesiculosus TaxID=180088 RepID=A0A1J8PNF8_9AGAM|nr:hypothetical protein AZE42_11624 [Rhizopogon vesiculosus]
MQPRTKKGPLWADEVKESHPVLSPTDPPETNTIPEGLDDNEAISDIKWMRPLVAPRFAGAHSSRPVSPTKSGE